LGALPQQRYRRLADGLLRQRVHDETLHSDGARADIQVAKIYGLSRLQGR
jgi:hypothetical protein